MSSRAACFASGPGGPRLCPDTCAVLASMSQSCRGFMTNRCPLGVRPVRFMRPVPNAASAASPTLRSTAGSRHARSGIRWVSVLKSRVIGDECSVTCHVNSTSDTRLKRPRRRPLEVDRRDHVAVDLGAEVPRARAVGRDGRVERPAVHRVAMPDRRVRRAAGMTRRNGEAPGRVPTGTAAR